MESRSYQRNFFSGYYILYLITQKELTSFSVNSELSVNSFPKLVQQAQVKITIFFAETFRVFSYSTHWQFPLVSFILHCSQRFEEGSTEVFWYMYIGYCVQFLHQCHRSCSLPLTYSTISSLRFQEVYSILSLNKHCHLPPFLPRTLQ